MRVGIMGRSRMLLRSAGALAEAGHEIVFVQTCEGEDYYGVGPDDFAEFAREHGVPYACGRRLSERLEVFRASGCELAVSVNWPSLLPAALLDLFPHGVLNAHAGDLPRYRGNACPNWAILNGEDHIGLAIHRMVKEVDAGPVIERARLPIDDTTYIGDVYKWLETAVPALFVRAVGRLPDAAFTPQDPAIRPLRAFPRRPEDSRIDWHQPLRAILALVRASSHPFPGAFSFLEGTQKIQILRARAFHPDFDFLAVPGQVCLVTREANPVIAAADGMLEIEQCASEGRDDAETRRLVGRSLRARLV